MVRRAALEHVGEGLGRRRHRPQRWRMGVLLPEDGAGQGGARGTEKKATIHGRAISGNVASPMSY
jgi:hypothetical protein